MDPTKCNVTHRTELPLTSDLHPVPRINTKCGRLTACWLLTQQASAIDQFLSSTRCDVAAAELGYHVESPHNLTEDAGTADGRIEGAHMTWTAVRRQDIRMRHRRGHNYAVDGVSSRSLRLTCPSLLVHTLSQFCSLVLRSDVRSHGLCQPRHSRPICGRHDADSWIRIPVEYT